MVLPGPRKVSTNWDLDSIFSNSLTDLPDTLRKRGAAAEELPLTLDAIKQNVDAGRYRRLDKFQEDLFSLLHKARQVASSPDSQIFGDSVDLQALYLKRRDELCRNVLCSPACLYIHSQFTAEINELRRVRKKRTTALPATPEAPTSPESGKQNGPDDADEVVEGGEVRTGESFGFKKRASLFQAPTASTEGTDGEKGAEDAPAAGLESVEHGGVTYRLRDYVYVKDTNRGGGSGEPHIMRLEGIERDEEDSAGVVLVKGECSRCKNLQLGPNWPQLGPIKPQLGTKNLQLGPKIPQLGPGNLQLDLNKSRLSPNRPQSPQLGPDRPTVGPGRLQ